MDRTNAGERALATATTDTGAEAIEFVRFCHRRRRVGWPELYDEMCAVAGRGLYRGYGPEELAGIGIGLGLFQMPAMAGLTATVVAEDMERRRRAAAAVRTSLGAEAESPFESERPQRTEPEVNEVTAAGHGSIRIAVPAGA